MSATNRRPDFFVLGAPKCGTTSLARWLGRHPDVFVTSPKEPRFFNTDFDLPGRPKDLSAYEALYADAGGARVAGEATTGYLCSAVAVDAILEYQPEARFIVCLRPPAEMVVSLHAQRLKEGVENVASLPEAWALQGERAEGRRVPVLCPDHQMLAYGSICSLGSQVGRLLRKVDREKVLFMLLDDLRDHSAREYLRALEFLGVADDGFRDFARHNAGSVPGRPWVAQLQRGLGLAKHSLGIRRNFNFAGRLLRRATASAPPASVPEEFMKYLRQYFRDEVRVLEEHLRRQLPEWERNRA